MGREDLPRVTGKGPQIFAGGGIFSVEKEFIMFKKTFLKTIVVICVIIFMKEVYPETILSTDTSIQGINFPKGTKVYFYESGELSDVILSQDQKIQGINFPKGTGIGFSRNGKLAGARLPFGCDQEIQGIPCTGDYRIKFYESGNLRHAKLSRDKEIQSILCAEGHQIVLYESGKLTVATLAQDQEIQGVKFSKGTNISLYESGKLKQADLFQDQEIQGIFCSRAYFYESGKLKSAELSQNQEIQGRKCATGSFVTFYESGKIETAELLKSSADISDFPIFGRDEIRYSCPVWSRDGSRIFYVKDVVHWKTSFSSILTSFITGGSGRVITKSASYIMSMKPDGSNKKVITKFIVIRYENENISGNSPAYVRDLRMLPNNDEIIFFIRAASGYKGWIYKVNVNGTNLVKLLDIGNTTTAPNLFISPDGRNLAYTKERYDIFPWYNSSWLVDNDGKNNCMIAGEASHVIGWTLDGKLVISALADLEGNIKPEYSASGNKISYDENVREQILVYDLKFKEISRRIPKNINEAEIILKSLNIIKQDDTVYFDGSKKLFSLDDRSIGIGSINRENLKVLLKGKE